MEQSKIIDMLETYQQGVGTSLDWFSVDTEASGGGTPDLFYSSMFLGYMDIYR